MNIDIIIPVVNVDLAENLLRDIENNTLLPKEVIIIDNSSSIKPHSVFRYDTDKFIITYYYSTTGLVNESINLGISKLSNSCNLVSILNDDIRIGNWFFQRVKETFQVNPRCGVACPNTSVKYDIPPQKGRVRYVRMGEREGWAPTFKKKMLDKIPSIPHLKITTFHGDDWFWYYSHKLGYIWVKDVGNRIQHFVGASVRKKGLRAIKRKERTAWRKIKKDL